MHNISLRVGHKPRKTFYLPASWAELKPDQWQQVGRIVDDGEAKDLFALLALWSGLTLTHLDALDDEQRLGLLELLAWTNTPPTRWMEPVLTFPRPGVRFAPKKERLRGPGDDLTSLSFGGFMFAEDGLKKIQGKFEFMGGRADLAAALYTPLDRHGKPEAFSIEAMNERSKRMLARTHYDLLARTHFNYLGARAELIRSFPGIFTPTTGSQGGSSTWLDVGLSLARQTPALGTYAQLEQTNVYLVLTTLQALIDEAEKLKSKTPK